MWQVLLAAAAAAGTGILAKKLTNPIDTQRPIYDFDQNDQECEQNIHIHSQDSVFPSDDVFRECNGLEMRETNSDDGKIFRFSSTRRGSKGSRKKLGSGFRGLGKNSCAIYGKTDWPVENGFMVNQSAKRISVCLKKRRTGKHAAGKCESCASKDNSFGLGVGVGIMCMISAGRAEISRLNYAMDETARIVQGLKAEISRRKGLHNEYEDERNIMHISTIHNGTLFTKAVTKNKDDIKTICPYSAAAGQCSSSKDTEDQQPEVLEMDQLEAELESELQKLPWCATEGSGSEGKTDVLETEVLSGEVHQKDYHNSNSYQCSGVPAAELDKKLCHLLIERQESQIMEYEAELHQAHSKLHDKEAELQALKDCVKRLTELSLASASDEDTEDPEEDEKRSYGDEETMELDSRKSIVGMKRAMGYKSYTCSTK